MPEWLLVVLLVLGAYRVTRLVTVDEFPPIGDPRERFVERHPGSWVGYLWTCPFCMGVWAAAVLVALTWLVLTVWGDGLPLPLLVWAAVAGAVSLIYEVLERD